MRCGIYRPISSSNQSYNKLSKNSLIYSPGYIIYIHMYILNIVSITKTNIFVRLYDILP